MPIIVTKSFINYQATAKLFIDLHIACKTEALHNTSFDNFSPPSNHKAIAQLRQLWNGDARSDGPPVRPGDDDYWAGILEEEDDDDYVPDARDDDSTARTISGLTPLEM